MDNSRNYLLVTACKNEAENLPDLIKSVIAQTIQPIVWVIVDDGSTDDTLKIANNASAKYNWIHILQLKEAKRDLGLHYANVVKIGFDYAISICEENSIEYEYLGNLDGDLILEHTFYESLMNEFLKDSRLSIASGGTKHLIGAKIKYAKASKDEPSGGHMLIRINFFKECKGIPLAYSIDSVLKAKARLQGWNCRRFDKIIATEIRDVNNAEGYLKGFTTKGVAHYYLNFHPLHVFIKSIIFSFKRPYFVGVIYFASYLNSFIHRTKQIEDPEIRNYFWNKWKKKFD